MGDRAQEQRLYTTHCHPDKKPRFIGRPAIINGKRSIAYMKDGTVESYISLDEVNEQVFREGVPEMKVGF